MKVENLQLIHLDHDPQTLRPGTKLGIGVLQYISLVCCWKSPRRTINAIKTIRKIITNRDPMKEVNILEKKKSGHCVYWHITVLIGRSS